MRLALKELRRQPGRFVTAIITLTLIGLLTLFLGGILDGLINSSTGAIRAQQADVIVYSSSAQGSFARSRITPEVRAQVATAPGVSEVGGLSVTQLGARVPGRGVRDLADVALFGYQLAPRGVPAPPPAGQAYADSRLTSAGFAEGTTVLIGPARTPITIVGFVDDTGFSGQGSLWASDDTWRETQNANRPDARVAPGVSQALVVRGTGDPAALAQAVDRATGGATASLAKAAAVDGVPGVSEQRATFNQIIGVTLVIAVVVIALFFALLTVERTALYGVLKALGGRSRSLFGGVVLQALAVTAVAAVIAGGLAVAIDVLVPPGGIPFDLSAPRLASSVVLLFLAAILGCVFSLRRVLRVDPASAIGSAS